jgi:hypothetical protein
VDAIAEDECGEGVGWARELLADCVYRAGRCLEDLGDRAKAARLYRTYLALRDLGVGSIYARGEAVKRLREVTASREDGAEEGLLRGAVRELARV